MLFPRAIARRAHPLRFIAALVGGHGLFAFALRQPEFEAQRAHVHGPHRFTAQRGGKSFMRLELAHQTRRPGPVRHVTDRRVVANGTLTGYTFDVNDLAHTFSSSATCPACGTRSRVPGTR